MYTDLTTTYGYPPGDGDTGLTGGVPGDPLFIMIIIPTGGRTGVIILYAIRTGYTMPTASTGPTDPLL